MTNLDRLIRIMEFDSANSFKFTETDKLLEIEFSDNVFRQYIMSGEDIDAVKEKFFWYIVENFVSYYKPMRLKYEL
jgi:hypothetical protein